MNTVNTASSFQLKTRVRVGLFGGTFDPIHIGHSYAAMWPLLTGALDEVLVVPTLNPEGKTPVYSIKDRVAMARRALGGIDGISVIDTENLCAAREILNDVGHDSSYKLVKVLKNQGYTSISLIVGSDITEESISRWDNGDKLLSEISGLTRIPRAVVPCSSSSIKEALMDGHIHPLRFIKQDVALMFLPEKFPLTAGDIARFYEGY